MERGGEDSRKENSIRSEAWVSTAIRHSVWQKYKQALSSRSTKGSEIQTDVSF